MEEVWKDIEGYEGYYQISNLGRVRSLDRIACDGRKIKGRILKQKKDKDGYKQVELCLNSKSTTYKVHRLVAFAFIKNPDNLPQVGHKDESRDNNCAYNLEWCTAKENCNMPKRIHKLSFENYNAKKVICDNIIFPSIKICANYYNVDEYSMRNWLNKNSKAKMPNEFVKKGLDYYITKI